MVKGGQLSLAVITCDPYVQKIRFPLQMLFQIISMALCLCEAIFPGQKCEMTLFLSGDLGQYGDEDAAPDGVAARRSGSGRVSVQSWRKETSPVSQLGHQSLRLVFLTLSWAGGGWRGVDTSLKVSSSCRGFDACCIKTGFSWCCWLRCFP